MGIGFEPGDAKWSYSGFNTFREHLAYAIGIKDLRAIWRSQDWPEGEALVLLLNHSDCDGVLTWEECQQAAPRLREVIAAWERPGKTIYFEEHCNGYDYHHAGLLADAMEKCVREKIDLKFC